MSGPRRRTRQRSSTGGSFTSLCGILIIAMLIVGVSVPSASFSHGEVPRGAAVDVTTDTNAAHALGVAQAVYINDTSELVNVTNHLGRDVTITVTLRSDSDHIGDLVVDGVTSGNETTFDLAEGTTERVKIEIPDDSSLTDETVYFHVNATNPGLTVKAPDRKAPVNA